MTWTLFDEHLYNFKIEDLNTVDMTFNKENEITGKKESKIPDNLKILFDLDVSRKGEFMGMEDLDKIMNKTYLSMGVKTTDMSKRVREVGLDFIEKSIVHMWNGLLEYWIPYREARHDKKEQ